MTFRPLSAGDRPLLRQATLANMNWNTSRFTFEDVDNSDEISHYFRHFPGDRDFGILDHEAGNVRSVAWLVFLPERNPGYGFVNADTPELSITTFDGFRGQGIGTAVLRELIHTAKSRGVKDISLSVEDGNAVRRLYERRGFRIVGRNGGSDTMLLSLT
ncbi:MULTISPECIES: GNAT family N-acetyltransferase [Arthrobacter]|uniref:GNAT family N-acetyltransferase n=1 Tax=Arthrobacter terricola TaxID=2547396 RepID=A0A4V2ZS89_9MICC|nr:MULTISPECIES: GNAT family N-acetyltransferase [Arthrobacter]MBT8163043.1 GNAT family N-acetyltransferase [Arthrobacter sp. GN70]TDF91754.1 GNAT family N-acetyltransferase [Arthrobacter terricola]